MSKGKIDKDGSYGYFSKVGVIRASMVYTEKYSCLVSNGEKYLGFGHRLNIELGEPENKLYFTSEDARSLAGVYYNGRVVTN